ncbi:hypothetical protein [Nocardia concava]|uniref:hypothetical protein n=1 Tax=Nocardia concava TaxID=257281 RepID=UPI0012FA670A|nr:hypothetical protein [Nocardia concava]
MASTARPPTPSDGGDAVGDQSPDTIEIDRVGVVERQDDPELLGYRSGVHGQERPIGSAGPLDHHHRRLDMPADPVRPDWLPTSPVHRGKGPTGQSVWWFS